MRESRVSGDLVFELPDDSGLQAVAVERHPGGGAGVLSSADHDTVEEAIRESEGEAIVVDLEGRPGSDRFAARLETAQPGDRYFAVAFDDENNVYLTGRGAVADAAGARLDISLGSSEEEGAEDEGAVLIAPGRVARLWFKKVVHLPQRDLGLFEISRGVAGSLEYQPLPHLAKGPRTAVILHGALSELRAMEDLSNYLLEDDYERVVGFDYETVATAVSDNGRKLAQAVADVEPGSLDLIAYSMGTQVARSFLEEHGGSRAVSRVILVAPPHWGTPLATEEDRILKWGSLLIGGIPGALGVVLGLLFRAVELADTGLDDMKPRSEFQIRVAALERDRGVVHKTVTGVAEEAPRSNFLRRLLGSAGQTYFGGNHDWVVPFESSSRGPVDDPQILWDTNHFGFFRDRCAPIAHLLDRWLA